MEKHELVTFQTGADIIRVSKPAMKIDESMLVSAHEDRVHGLIDFLQRPIPIGRYTWITTDAPRDILLNLPFPETIWNQPMWAEKLKGFRYLRADLNFQFQVNGAPFDVGRLWCFWSPFDAERGDRRPIASRTNMTGYPGVEVDVGNQMTAELTIPYVSMYTHIDQLLGSQPYGALRVSVMSQFFSVNNSSASVTVYCWMSNVDLAIPTDTKTLGATVPFTAQSGRGRRVVMGKTEQETRSKKGIVTTGATIVGDVAKMFANVPVIGEVAKPVAWVADAVKGVASFLGFSKPNSIETTSTFAQVPAKGMTHSDGLDNSVVLGSKPDNEIESKHSVFGTEIDEMNIPYVVGRPNWIEAFNWQTVDPILGEPLWTIPVHAGICGTEILSGMPSSQWTATHMATIASMFRFWRGAVSFRFTAVKNQFYSGRLVFVFYPGIRAGQITTYTDFDVSKNYQWIWDIRRDEDIQLTIPFQSNLQYLRVRMHNNDRGTEAEDLGSDTITGTLAVYVDNQLRAPASVEPNIWIHCWVHGGADMTFAVPDMTPYSPTDNQAGWLLETIPTPAYEDPPFVAQMMEIEDTYDVNHQETGQENPEGSSLLVSKPKTSMTPELSCVGELHNNLRPLTRRFGYEYSYANNGNPLNALALDPAFFFTTVSQTQNNPINYISRLYCFYRGSVRYKLLTSMYTVLTGSVAGTERVTNPLMIGSTAQLLSTSPIGYGTAINSPDNFAAGRFIHPQPMTNNPFLEIMCPYFSNVPMQLISKTYITNLHLRMIYKIIFQNASADSSQDSRLFKAAGDDFSFGYLVGAPVIALSAMQ